MYVYPGVHQPRVHKFCVVGGYVYAGVHQPRVHKFCVVGGNVYVYAGVHK